MARVLSLFSLSLLLGLVPLVACDGEVLETKAQLLEHGRSEGGEMYYLSLKHRDAPNSPFLRRYESREEYLRMALRRDEERARSFGEHIACRRARLATGAVANRMDAGSPPGPLALEARVLLAPAGAGEYYTELYVGTPRQLQAAMVDFGSDVVWFGSRAREIPGDAAYSHFYPASSSSFIPTLRVKTKPCRLDFAYESLRFNKTHRHQREEMLDVMISVSEVPAPTGGVLGLGLGKASLATQLRDNRIAYCLSDTDEPAGSSLVLGGGLHPELKFTPLVRHRHVETFLLVNLVAVFVDDVKLPLATSVVVDMSTKFSRLPARAVRRIVAALRARIELPTVSVPGFQLCYSLANSDILQVPPVTLVFGGEARMRLPMENLFVPASEDRDVMCLAILSRRPGTPPVLGASQQLNFLVVADRERSRLGFARWQCASRPPW